MKLDTRIPVNKYLANGRVRVTLTSKVTGEHITLRLRCKNRQIKGRYISFEQAAILVADAGQGGHDMVGFVKVLSPNPVVIPNKGADAARVWAFEKLWHYCRTGELHPQLDLDIMSFCGRCSRELNDPISIERGLGPECYGERTGSKHQHRETCREHGEPLPCSLCEQLEALNQMTLAQEGSWRYNLQRS